MYAYCNNLQGSAVDLDLLRSLNIGRRNLQPADPPANRSRRSFSTVAARPPAARSRGRLGSFEDKSRLVAQIFSLQVSEKCEDVLLCDLLLLEEVSHQPASDGLADLYAGCDHLTNSLRSLSHIDCDWLILF